MLYERINHNSMFVYMPELEAIFAVLNMLQGGGGMKLCEEVYGQEQITVWKKQYLFLFETSRAVQKIYPWGIWDFIIDIPLQGMNLERYKEYLLKMDQVDFLWRHLDLDYVEGANKEDLRAAITNDKLLDQVFDWVTDKCESFLSFKAFVRESRRYIEDFFTMAKELQNPLLEAVLDKHEGAVASMKKEIISGIDEAGPFDYSQKIMGKTFRNCGPYEEFIFVPTYMMPGKACRFFHIKEEHKKQLLFISLREQNRNREEVLKALKVMGDGTRYQILILLAQEGSMRGMDIAKRVSVATSTVSHHMEQLKECGLITEEQVKNSKYYGLNRNSVAGLINDLQKDLRIE